MKPVEPEDKRSLSKRALSRHANEAMLNKKKQSQLTKSPVKRI